MIQNPLALAVLEGKFHDGDRVVVGLAKDGTLTLEKAGA
jgi:hypothetical protein